MEEYQQRVLVRAYFLWENGYSHDALVNYYQAEKEELREEKSVDENSSDESSISSSEDEDRPRLSVSQIFNRVIPRSK